MPSLCACNGGVLVPYDIAQTCTALGKCSYLFFYFSQLESLYDEALPELVKRQFRKPKEIDSPLDQSHNTSSMCKCGSHFVLVAAIV